MACCLPGSGSIPCTASASDRTAVAKLWPIEDSAPLGAELRTEPRARTSLVATLHSADGEELPVVVLDVSTRGALIETEHAPRPNTSYTLTFWAFGDSYSAQLDVVRCESSADGYFWGCRTNLTMDGLDRLSSVVRAALGESATRVRGWEEINREAGGQRAGAKIVVGHTPSGKAIEMAAQDALEMGWEGVDLFVRVVGSLEIM